MSHVAEGHNQGAAVFQPPTDRTALKKRRSLDKTATCAAVWSAVQL